MNQCLASVVIEHFSRDHATAAGNSTRVDVAGMDQQPDGFGPAIVVEGRLRKLVCVEIEIKCLVVISCPGLLHDNIALPVEDGQPHLFVCCAASVRRVKGTEPEGFPMGDASLNDEANLVCRLLLE